MRNGEKQEKAIEDQGEKKLVAFNRHDKKGDLDISDRYDEKDGTLWYKNTKNKWN